MGDAVPVQNCERFCFWYSELCNLLENGFLPNWIFFFFFKEVSNIAIIHPFVDRQTADLVWLRFAANDSGFVHSAWRTFRLAVDSQNIFDPGD